MLVTRQEAVNEVLARLGTTADNIDTTDLTSIRLRLNQVQDSIWYDRNWSWRKRTYFLTTRKPYSTGTITVTENSRTVTGSGTTWTPSMVTGYILVNGKFYKIQSRSDATTFILEAPYPDSTESGATYKVVFPDMHLPHEIDSIVSVKVSDQYIDVVDRDQLVNGLDTPGFPQQAAFGDRSKTDYYNAGTVTVTDGSTTITGSGTAFESQMEGMSFRSNDFSKSYVIQSVDSTTQLTLRDKFEGTTASGKSYTVGAAGTPMLTFRSAPDDYYYVEIEALIGSDKLVSDSAYSLIPNHAPLLHGAIWLCLTDFKNMNPVRIQQARADFERTLEQLRSTYGTVGNLQWKSPEATYAQRTGMGNFNPLKEIL